MTGLSSFSSLNNIPLNIYNKFIILFNIYLFFNTHFLIIYYINIFFYISTYYICVYNFLIHSYMDWQFVSSLWLSWVTLHKTAAQRALPGSDCISFGYIMWKQDGWVTQYFYIYFMEEFHTLFQNDCPRLQSH